MHVGKTRDISNTNDLLNYAFENGMIDVSCIYQIVEMKKRKEYLEKHPNKIWQGKDGYWYTYLPEAEGRVLKRIKEKSDLEDIIVDFWKDEEDNPTITALFNEWISNKIQDNEISPGTKNRYENQFLQCFKAICNKRIKSITEYMIDEFVRKTINDNKLTVKGYSNMRTILYGIFRLAKKKKLITFSITEIVKDIDVSRKSFRREIKEDDEEVFMEDELPLVLDYLENNSDLINLGLLLVFKSGLRIGELVALKYCDIQKNVIHVHRTEIKYKENGQMIYEVRDFPKTEAGIRDVIIPDNALWIIKRIRSINPFGEYLFETNGARIRTYVFNNRIKTVCKKVNVKPKSPHKIRKTYGTILIDSGVDESLLLSQMGHTDIRTTKGHYYKNRKTLEGKITSINNVSSL